VIVPDINLLVYAHNEAAAFHERARNWWQEQMAGPTPVAIPWVVVFGFIRLVTHPAILTAPLAPGEALDRVDDWFGQEHVRVLVPGPRHLQIARDLFRATGVGGGLTTDTHLATLAIEHGAEFHSNDHDFERFPGLRLRNPLS
jgi:toxin-antitoxin system PIN domain toxin